MDSEAESYAPVVSWSTIRFFLTLVSMLNWTTVSVDWANAFIQAELEEPMYMSTPRGFKNNNFGVLGCLKVFKSLYGSKFASLNWYKNLRHALLTKLGMRESSVDKCLLFRPGLFLILYVDDAGIAAANRSIIDDFVKELRDLGFDLDIEDDFSSYLGIGIEELPDGSRRMTQKGLIKKVIKPSWATVGGHLGAKCGILLHFLAHWPTSPSSPLEDPLDLPAPTSRRSKSSSSRSLSRNPNQSKTNQLILPLLDPMTLVF